MNENVGQLFLLFKANTIRYYLLRPIILDEKIKDIDIIIPKEDLNRLLKVLIIKYGEVLYKKSRANKSIQLIANEILLDIKFNMCFLPRKSLVLKENLPYTDVKLAEKDVLIPNSSNEILFTFWTFHMLLDKKNPGESSTFHLYKKYYLQDWRVYMATDFFNKWIKIIFKEKQSLARKIIELFFENGILINDTDPGNSLKKLILKNDLSLQLKYLFDKFRYGIHRHLKINENYKTIKKVTN